MSNPTCPPNRRFDLWSMLPKHNRREDATGDLRKFVSCLQEVTDELLAEVDRFSDLFYIERAPEDFVDLILQDLGNPFKFDLLVIEKRRLAATLLDMYKLRGTAPGIKNAVRFFLGLEIHIVPHAANVVTLGKSQLDMDWILGPSEEFARYAFDVMVDQKLTGSQRRHLTKLVSGLRPAHTHFIDLKEPEKPEATTFWILGVGKLGAASMLEQNLPKSVPNFQPIPL